MSSEINICLSTDKNYVSALSVTIVSILKNAKKSENLHFYILCENLSDDIKDKILLLKKIKDCKFDFIDIDPKLFENFYTSGHIKLASYYRILLPELLPNVSKILYLDCDIVVLSSLAPLFNTDINKVLIAGVEDVGVSYWYRFTDNCPYKMNNILNSGVLLINLDLWRKENIINKIYELQSEGYGNCQHDQELINIACHDKFLLLDYSWNVQDSFLRSRESIRRSPFYKYIKQSLKRINIFHYTTVDKPWKNVTFPKSELWWHYNSYSPFKLKMSNKDKLKYLIKFFREERPNKIIYKFFGINFTKKLVQSNIQKKN